MSKRKAPSSDNFNTEFCEWLMELADYEKNISRNIHKYNAYRKAASVLASHNKKIQSGAEAKKLNGIGEKIAKKIDEYLQTGKLKKLENILNDDDTKAITLLTQVSGIGPVKAAELVRNGIKTIEDLKNNKQMLTHHQQIGLKYFDDFKKMIPRSEIHQIEEKIKETLFNADPGFTVTICGSYRRGKTESGDIDALVTHTTLKVQNKQKSGEQLIKKLVLCLDKLITDTISLGETKFMGVCRLSKELPSRRIDIRLIPSEQYHCAVLYFTGSDLFNKLMRAHALERGFTLNEYTLRPIGVTGKPGEAVAITSENDIFDYIDYPYKLPEERNV